MKDSISAANHDCYENYHTKDKSKPNTLGVKVVPMVTDVEEAYVGSFIVDNRFKLISPHFCSLIMTDN